MDGNHKLSSRHQRSKSLHVSPLPSRRNKTGTLPVTGSSSQPEHPEQLALGSAKAFQPDSYLDGGSRSSRTSRGENLVRLTAEPSKAHSMRPAGSQTASNSQGISSSGIFRQETEQTATSRAAPPVPSQPSVLKPGKSPVGAYISSAEEDDVSVDLPRTAPFVSPTVSCTLLRSSSLSKPQSPPSSESSWTTDAASLSKRRKNTARAVITREIDEANAALKVEHDWDYSETARWGWIILIATWIIFVVGVGSCLNVWAWAWDVGEAPSAATTILHDPTLPIDGYYPALLVMTAVMSWVWVVVAWVGMKYFKHAKIQGEGT